MEGSFDHLFDAPSSGEHRERHSLGLRRRRLRFLCRARPDRFGSVELGSWSRTEAQW